MPMTVNAALPSPFVHLDNRAFVLSSGGRAISFALSSAGRWLEETLMIILDEGRATRTQGDRVLGGFISEDERTVTVYGGSREDLIVVAVDTPEFEKLQKALTDALHQHPDAHSAADAKDGGRGRLRLRH